MGWQKHDLIFRLISPLHIGWRKTGNLMQTRGYVPARNLWGALTARLTRDYNNGSSDQCYQTIGNLVKTHFRFTYFYPALGDLYEKHYLWQGDFDYLFLDSYATTALNYDSQSADDASLHETEFIAPRTRDDQSVYLAGNMYIQDNLPTCCEQWQTALTRLQIGGEQHYGWGRLKLAKQEPIEGVLEQPIQTLDDTLKIPNKNKWRVPAHLQLPPNNTISLTGPIEPVLGWNRNPTPKNGKLWDLSKAEICYAPGAVIDDNQTFLIDENGWLKLS